MEKASAQIQDLKKQSEALLDQTIQLIEKGQELGQFKQGNASEMAYYYTASIQGLMTVKLALGEKFKTPRLQIVTAFLMKDDRD